MLPNRDPLRCPVGALAVLLHYEFDQEELVMRTNGWDWSKAASWRQVSSGLSDALVASPPVLLQVKLLFGRKVGVPCSGSALRKMYTTFLENTTIKSHKKLHLARHTIPTLMEDMG